MTCQRVLARLPDDPAGETVDWVDLHWRQTVRRALRLVSRGNRRVNVLLPRDHPPLHHGDVLAEVDAAPSALVPVARIAVFVAPVPLLRLRPVTPRTLALLCAQLGNLHLPLQVLNDAILTPDDGPARELLDTLGVPCETRVDRFHPERFSVISELGQPGQTVRIKTASPTPRP